MMAKQKECRNEYIKENLTKEGYWKAGKGAWRVNVKLSKVIEANGMLGGPITIIGKDSQGNYIKGQIYRREHGRKSQKWEDLHKVIKVQKEYTNPDLTKYVVYEPESLEGIWLKGEADQRDIMLHGEKGYYDEHGYDFRNDPKPYIDKKPMCSIRKRGK